jgi:hypothetical protein
MSKCFSVKEEGQLVEVDVQQKPNRPRYLDQVHVGW